MFSNFLAANNLALNCCSVNSNPFLPINTCFIIGSFRLRFVQDLKHRQEHLSIRYIQILIANSFKVVLQKSAWFFFLVENHSCILARFWNSKITYFFKNHEEYQKNSISGSSISSLHHDALI
jgi:hypothetical protein